MNDLWTCLNDGRFWSYVKLNSVRVIMLWDSGASISVISKHMWSKIGSPIMKNYEMSVAGVFGRSQQVLGICKLSLEWNNLVKTINAIIMEKITPHFIAGVDIMKECQVSLQFGDFVQCVSKDGGKWSDSDRQKKIHESIKDLETNFNLKSMLDTYRSIFMAHKFDLGFTDIVKHRIQTESAPIYLNPRRQPMHIEDLIDEMIKLMLDHDVIRPCRSPWNSPLVAAKKKDGSLRLCVDFRQLNSVTKRESFPMPDIQSLLDSLAGSNVFSSIDIGQAYYQVALDTDAQEMTAFSTKAGQFCYNRLPFGLTSAPATFQSLMHVIFEDLLFKGVIVYLDDILIYGKSREEHNGILEKVFQRILKAGFRINPDKCQFFKSSLIFLGHVISPEGVKTNNDNVQKIINIDIPKTVKEMRSFLGMTNYYRKFIKNYANIALPLYAATKGNDKAITWSDECNSSFIKLKDALVSAPVLDYPRKDRKFVLDTDASFEAIGAVLSQIDENNQERVIAYASRGLTPFEKGYCVTRKELLALYDSILHFKAYLYGTEFEARTDHKALVFMRDTKKPISPQFQTWLVNLSEYNFKLTYRKGEHHSNADYMSRIGMCKHCETEHENPKLSKSRTKFISAINSIGNVYEVLKGKQDNDKDIQFVKGAILKQNSKKEIRIDNYDNRWLEKNFQNLVVVDNLLMLKKSIVIPISYSEEFVKVVHEDMCHIGMKKLYNYVKDDFVWNDVFKTVHKVINECETCAKRKICQQKTKEKFIPITKSNFLDQVQIDIAYMSINGLQKGYVLILVDKFSRLVSLNYVNNQTENTIIRTIEDKWIYRFGKPKEILTDRGRYFLGTKFQKWLQSLNVKHNLTTPYHHQGTGLVERMIRTMRDMLVTLLQTKKLTNWTDILPKVEFCMNATISSGTSVSPFELIYGRRISLHGFNGEAGDRKEIESKARESQKKASEKIENYENDKRTNRSFKIGQKVYVKIEPQNRSKNGFQYQGPYQILEFLSPHQVLIDFPTGAASRSIEWLKVHHE